MRKHPVIFGVLILLVFSAVLYLYFYKAGLNSGKSRSFSLRDKIGVVSVEGIISDSMEITEQLG